jgi:hypothetical protein
MPLAAAPLPVYQTPQSAGNAPLQIPWYPWDTGQNEWCWAACAQMLAFFFQNSVTQQCDFASKMLPGQDCCQDPGSCNTALDIIRIKELFSLFGKSEPPCIDHPVTFEQIQAEILAGRPVQVGYRWDDGNGHVAIVAGAGENDYGQFLYVNDPDPEFACGWCRFSDVQAAYGRGSWQWTWMPIR